MYIPVEEELYEIWDVAPEGYTPKVEILGYPPSCVSCNWVDDVGISWGFMNMFMTPDAHFFPDLWLQEPIKFTGIFTNLIFKGVPYWRQYISYWVIPQWNDVSRVIFEGVGFRLDESFPGKYSGYALAADLSTVDSPVNEWYAAKLAEAGE